MDRSVDFEDALRFVLNYNLNYLISFHNTMRSLLREKLGMLEAQNDPVIQTKIELYDKMNSANVLLLALGFLEEMMIIIWKRRFPEDSIPDGSSILRYKPLMKNLGLDLANMPCWNVLLDAYKVRNCLLHANGRIDLMKDPIEMRLCIKQHGDVLDKRLERVVVTSLF